MSDQPVCHICGWNHPPHETFSRTFTPTVRSTTTTRTFGPCWQCGGKGQVHYTELTSNSFECPRCVGSGQIVVSETVREDG